MTRISAKRVFSVRKKENPENSNTSIPDALIEKVQKSAIEPCSDFYPSGSLGDVITTSTVAAALGLSSSSQRRKEAELLEFIVNDAKIVFAILCLSPFIKTAEKLLTSIQKFKADQFGDDKLPYVLKSAPIARTATGDNYLRSFVQEQWKFLAPVFKAGSANTQNIQDIGMIGDEYKGWLWSCHSQAMLPFISKSDEAKSGAFGDVWRVEPHRDHVPQDWSTQIALKEVKLDATNGGAEAARKDWLRELQGHVEMNSLLHANIVKFYGAVIRDTRQWLMMEWADGGTLQEFMIENPNPPLTAELLSQILQQIRALTHALESMHAEEQKQHYRHGDLKPANILRFKTSTAGHVGIDVGTWKIGDMGLVKKQTLATGARGWSTTTRKSTIRYHPPEVLTRVNGGRWSRRYDVWSMGCIALEVIIWLLWGHAGLVNLDEALKIQPPLETGSYFKQDPSPPHTAKIHPAITKAMTYISSHPNGRADTVVGKLLRVIQTKLLVINVPGPSDGIDKDSTPPDTDGSTSSRPRFSISSSEMVESVRGSAKDFREDLDTILQDLRRAPPTMSPGTNTAPVFRVSDSSTLTVPDARPSAPLHNPVQGRTGQIPSNETLNHVWNFPVDNEFAKEVFSKLGSRVPETPDLKQSRLCGKCNVLNFTEPSFHIVDVYEELDAQRTSCDFCQLRWQVIKAQGLGNSSNIRFGRVESMLQLNQTSTPSLSIIHGPSANLGTVPKHIQLGFPRLLESRSSEHFGLLKQWLRDCNDNHVGCKPRQRRVPPTRLIYVGDDRNEGIRLCEPQRDSEVKYAALSHPWGEGEHFCTLPDTLHKHKDGIDFKDLPTTFQDAIITTRATGLEYLWIDSICIIQGSGGDFDQEAALMETVFSSADFVIAASSARGQHDGFLGEKASDWQTVSFEREGQPTYYVRPFVDDFAKDVLNSPLNSRGWVLQERALARRTIYFTKSQTYFECGEGVRCETLTRTTNKLASMLGDASFPSKMSSANADRGELIRSYQNLYTQYSALGLTRITDRPIAIAGLEKRLIQDLKAVGGYGVFDDKRSLLQHSLLWQRRTGVHALRRIDFSKTSYMAPTWSWMAYDGPIEFLDIPLGGVEWTNDSVQGRWPNSSETWHTGQTKVEPHLRVTAQDIFDHSSRDNNLVYDNPDLVRSRNVRAQCVVLGRQKTRGVARDNITHYVVLVAARTTAGQSVATYERIGVGSLLGKNISLDKKAVHTIMC